jgi:hypothetical protein
MGSTGRGRGDRHDQLNPEADQIRDEPRKPVCLSVGPSVFDMDILSLDVASLAKAAADSSTKPLAASGELPERKPMRRTLLAGWASTESAAASSRRMPTVVSLAMVDLKPFPHGRRQWSAQRPG